MIVNAEALEPATLADRVFDVCVVGTGPAGLSLARSLARQGKTVALMEGGDRDITFDSEEIYEGTIVGADYWPLTSCRKRFLGGSSNCWSGVCRELEDVDFAAKPYDAPSGWPIGAADLQPYAAETDDILTLPAAGGALRCVFGEDAAPLRPIELRYTGNARLGLRYVDELAADERITLHVNANLVDLTLDDRLQAVRAAVFRSFERPEPFEITAKAYALCLGGLENPRFLLNANRQVASGIGNAHGLVGCYFNEHPHQEIGRVVLAEPLRSREVYAPEPGFMADQEILNFALLLDPDVRQLALPNEIARTIACQTSFTERLAAAVYGKAFKCDEGGIGAYLAQWQEPETMLTATVDIMAEQALNPSSRVRLGQATDRFGLRRIELDWRFSEIDYRTVHMAAMTFGRMLAEHDVGRLKLNPWLTNGEGGLPGPDEARVGGPHHMCTTRMSDSPRQGVVDRNCRIHGMDNLYLGGSSVFGSGGFANPTYTIVQLALRLADHLASEVA